MTTTCPEAFLSAPIKLAAKISGARYNSSKSALEEQDRSSTRTRSPANLNSFNLNQTSFCSHFRVSVFRPTTRKCSGHLLASLLLPLLLSHYLQVSAHLNSQLINHDTGSAAARDGGDSQLRHHAHYLNFVPSATFSYQEGRQLNGRSLELNELTAIRPQDGPSKRSDESASSHIYKRSSAVLMPPTGSMSLLVQQAGHHTNQHQNQNHHQHLAPMSRRMMSNVAPPAQSMSLLAASQAEGSLVVTNANQNNNKQTNWLGVVSPSGNSARIQHQEGLEGRDQQSELLAAGSVQSVQHSQVTNQRDQEQRQQASGSNNNRKQAEQEAELLRQKQHIQYHDQWPSMAGKCHKRTLNFCASVLPFNTTTFPNIIGDTNRFEVKRSLPFFGFLAKSSCNKRLDELLCLLLEPPCSPTSGSAIPPCKKFCRLALEGCNEYIPATLALSSVFDCRQYPDSNEPGVCINLAQGSKCAQDEFKCPDKTCIPRNWVCDGVRDCIFAADEANCTDSAAVPRASVCSTEEFKCDGKCVPKAWKCDGERDCLDGSDEESCDLRPRCGPDRFKCADGNGCIPKRWVCDGKAECRDGSDEMNCNQRECSENDFKCDNGICIPKLWRCDRQLDCKDGSDERQCVYPTPTTTTSAPVTATAAELLLNASSSYAIAHQNQQAELSSSGLSGPSEEQQTSRAGLSRENQQQQLQQAKQQLEMNLSGDISRIIQHERESSSIQAMTTMASATSSTSTPLSKPVEQAEAAVSHASITTTKQEADVVVEDNPQQQQQTAVELAKEMEKFDYDLIQSSSSQVQANELPNANHHQQHFNKQLQMAQVIDFVPQQRQQQQPSNEQVELMPPVNRLQPQVVVPQPQAEQQQAQAQRVPIYRSVFKSLKGQQNGPQHHFRQQLDRNGNPRNVVAIARRRRDRNQQPQVMANEQSHRTMRQPRPSFQFGEKHDQVGQLVDLQQPPMAMAAQPQQQVQMHNHTRASSSVANYLQLLNSRYNFRLPRVGGGPSPASPSPTWSS